MDSAAGTPSGAGMAADLLGAPLVDAHCHLDDFADEGGESLAGVVARARAAGIVHLVVNGLWRAEDRGFGCALSLARRDPSFFSATVTVSPHDTAKATDADFDRAAALALDPAVCAIGETGLEYHYDVGGHGEQMDLMRRHVRLALAVKKPLVLHVRDGHGDALKVVKEEGAAGHPIQVHCFNGTLDEARRWIDLGCYLSFSGMLTFRKSEDIRSAAKTVPLDRMLVETDSPYLAPVPHRGKACEPAYVRHTLECLASLREMDVAEAARATSANAARLFGFSLPSSEGRAP